MSLSDHRVLANIAVDDIGRARAFYEGKLGLRPEAVRGDEGVTYRCADGTSLHVYPSPENAGRSTATQVGWIVPDLDAAVAELIANGVKLERYETDQLQTDPQGIAQIGDARAAWFRDPDGNVLSLIDS